MDFEKDQTDHNKTESINFSLGNVLFKCLEKYRGKILQYIGDTNEIDTYGEVLLRSIRTALKLKERGITRNDIISSCTHNHKNNIIPLMASLFLGIKSAHFDPNLSYLDTIHLLKLIKPKLIFVALESLSFMEKCVKESKVDTEFVVFGECKKYSNFSEYLKPQIEEDKFQPVVIDNPKETIVIMFSSGTTGLPKGICLNHYGLLALISNITFVSSRENENVSLLYTTLYWISAIMFLIKCIHGGGSRIVCAKFDPLNTWSLIEKYKITTIFLAPYHARDFLAVSRKNVDTSSLKYFLTGSTPVTVKLMKELREALPTAKVFQGYAQTEACGVISVFSADDPYEMELQNKKPLSCGKVMTSYKWKIVDPVTEEILGPNQRDEFRYKSDFLMNGYYNMDSSSAYDSEGYIKSGDITYYDDDGCLYIIDRIKEMFKYRGWHIVPAVLEEVILNHPAVKEAVVIGIPHEIDGDHAMGLVLLKKGYKHTTPEDIMRYVNEMVPETQQLRAGVKLVKEVIRTTTGKVKRTLMKKMVLDGEI